MDATKLKISEVQLEAAALSALLASGSHTNEDIFAMKLLSKILVLAVVASCLVALASAMPDPYALADADPEAVPDAGANADAKAGPHFGFRPFGFGGLGGFGGFGGFRRPFGLGYGGFRGGRFGRFGHGHFW
nr:pupal cuticle protein 36a-like [Penaeus vannamei]